MILVVIIKNYLSKGLNYTWLVIIASVTYSEALVGHLSYEGDLPLHIHVDPAQTPYMYLQFLGWRSCVRMRRCCQDGTWCSYSTGRYMQNWRQYLSIWRWELSLYTDRATKIPKRRLGGLTQLNKNTAFPPLFSFNSTKSLDPIKFGCWLKCGIYYQECCAWQHGAQIWYIQVHQ